jgi:hypothetical protein
MLVLTTLLGTPLVYLVLAFFIGLFETPANLERVSQTQPVVHSGDVSLSLKDKLPR